MARPRSDGSTEFGSDSFLDIIANLVGILIILIVLAGLNVARSPDPVETVTETEPTLDPIRVIPDPAPVPVEQPLLIAAGVAGESMRERSTIPLPDPTQRQTVLNADIFAVVPKIDAAPDPTRFSTPDPQPAPTVIPVDSNLRSEIDATSEAIAAHEQSLKKLRGATDLLRDDITRTTSTVAEIADQSRQLKTALDRRDGLLLELTQTVETAEAERTGLLRKIEVLEASTEPTESLVHRISPVSQQVDGPEFHFLVSDSQVSFVPLKELQAALKRDVERNKDWLLKQDRHRGSVGPIVGFTMHYQVARAAPTLQDRLNGPSGLVRIALSRWVLQPSPNRPQETVRKALDRNSRFVTQLRGMPAGSNLTFWIYPESFGAFTELKNFAQRAGFRVAARPLPSGVPITGSPNGSVSASQ